MRQAVCNRWTGLLDCPLSIPCMWFSTCTALAHMQNINQLETHCLFCLTRVAKKEERIFIQQSSVWEDVEVFKSNRDLIGFWWCCRHRVRPYCCHHTWFFSEVNCFSSLSVSWKTMVNMTFAWIANKLWCKCNVLPQVSSPPRFMLYGNIEPTSAHIWGIPPFAKMRSNPHLLPVGRSVGWAIHW